MTSNISNLAYIGEGVSLGENVCIGPGAVVLGPCTIQDNVWIGPGAQIGAPPEMSSLKQNTAWNNDLEHVGVLVMTGAVIREGAVIHQGSHRITTVGENTWILNRAYVAHDVQIGNDTVISAGVSIGGHCTIGNSVNIGMNSSVHQRRFVGDGSMIGMGTPVARNVPPYAKVFGTPARLKGVNKVALNKLGATEVHVSLLEEYFRKGEYLSSVFYKPEISEGFTASFDDWFSQDLTLAIKF